MVGGLQELRRESAYLDVVRIPMSSLLKKVLLVGCGNMGSAMLANWHRSAPALKVSVVEPSAALRLHASERTNEVYVSADELPHAFQPEVVVFAVKPQIIFDVVPRYSRFASNDAVLLSVAAGVTTRALQDVLPPGSRIVRCMPNTPAAVGAGMMVCVAGMNVGERDVDRVAQLLSMSGKVTFIADEALMDAVTAVSGSGPAYLFHFIECLAEAGRRAGLPAELANELALRTIGGASTLAMQSAKPASVLRREVTSPGGTTAAALDVFQRGGSLIELVASAVDAARRRSAELGMQHTTERVRGV
jgi:pyrroline-5-carboxylate reductase